MNMNTSVFGKTMEKVRNRRDIKLKTSDQRRNKWASVPSYHTTKQFWEKPQAIETSKILKQKSQCMGPSILGISKIAMYEYWYDCVKPNYGKKTKLCCIDMDSLIFHVKLEDTNADLVGSVKKRFDTSNYEVKRPLSIGKTNKNQANER